MKIKANVYLVMAALLAQPFLLTGCESGGDGERVNESDTMETTQVEEKLESDVQLELSISARELRVFRDGDTVTSYPIAVGTDEYPTPTGEYKIDQIDWNPDWTPPESDWTEGEEYTPPGDPDNPMGRVRIIYQAPYSLHGTRDLASLGKAESHGSVRLANEDVIALARMLMEATGDERPGSWYDRVLRDSTTMETVKLTVPVPITNKQ